jgi:WD40 repeat protein
LVATGSLQALTARVLDAVTGTELYRLDHDDNVRAVLFSLDGTQLGTGSGDLTRGDGPARVFDAVTGAEQCRLEHEDAVSPVGFSPDGTCMATCSWDQSTRVWLVNREQW